MDPFVSYRRNSKGSAKDPPAKVHPNILFGPGHYLDLGFINQYNITHIINCAFDECCSSFVKDTYRDKYVCLDAIDSPDVNITTWYPAFQEVMDKFLRSGGTVYVNCQAGKNRSGFLVALYCVMKFQYKYDQVCKAILLQRPCALENGVFHEQVQEYIKKHS